MGHHSYLVVGDSQFLYTRDDYNEELAALFNETDRELSVTDGSDVTSGDELDESACALGYYTTANALRQRLHVQGFTSSRALADLAEGIAQWRKTYDSQSQFRELEGRGERVFQTLVRRPREPAELLAAIGEAIRPHRSEKSFATVQEYFQYEDEFAETVSDVQELRWFVGERSLVRLIIDQAPDDTRAGLDLGELTGCCVSLDATQPIAGPTRERQLAALPDSAPLIVLTEGSTDSRLLTEAMHVTHPHLVGFVRFIDYTGTKARGSAGALAIMVNAFIAAGVANRFVAIADNDAGGHEALAKLKRQKLPVGCQVLHYPDLPLLASYPTVDSASATVSLTNVNGVAGSLEMYLGEDVLTIDGTLAPVHLGTFIPAVRCRQGALSKSHKVLVLKAFEEKIKKARLGQRSDTSHWSGVHAIIEGIVQAFG
ncbi:HEPN/Toprim-associated domain-containing protein [Streptomyces sp. NBC_00299]|uniref:HEPN/Toprim-associated domain-containing protein n=1 Tax=Streptomyces sp. NBC_00299 TaxID=2975705 RepID=UPI002E2C9C95|nr:HEPN/Toprim-associated domain-containing protein [Streptomyces sp. NBC_00299]